MARQGIRSRWLTETRLALGCSRHRRANVRGRCETEFLEPQAQPPVGRVCGTFELVGDRPRPEWVTSTVLVGVIVLFTGDETLLTFLGWSFVWLCGLAMIAGPLAIAVRRFLTSEVSSSFTLLREMAETRPRPGDLIPARCRVRAESVSVRFEPPDQFRPRADAGLRGWQSDSR